MNKIPLHDLHVALGAKIVPFAGFEMPVRYTSDKEEHLCVRNDVGVFDVSHMGEFMIEGPEALNLIQKVTSNDAAKLVDGQAQYSCLPNDKGGIVDDLIVYRFSAEKYLLVVNASNIEKDWNWISAQNSMGATMSNQSDEYVLLAVQGPKAVQTLQKLTEIDLSTIEFYHFREGVLAGEEMIISATGYTGAGGFELYVPKASAETVWKKVFEAGEEFNIKPIGLGARDTLRLEMGYCLYGNDINDETSPIEAGLGWITKFTKEFINHENILKHKEDGPSKRLVGFVMDGKGIPRAEYKILSAEGEELGVVTSGTLSPSMNVGVGLGYVKSGLHKSGTKIQIEVRNKQLPATITRPPFLK